MKVTIKTLQQVQFPIEVEANETIGQIKQRISETSESNKVAVERQKLIHSGKVLENELTVAQTALKEGDFIVLMTITPKPAKPAAITSTSTNPPVSESSASVPQATVSTSAIEAESRLVTGEAYEESIQRLVDMGFPREEVIHAMRASFNNPERAVEYLTTGVIPEAFEGPSGSGEAVEGETVTHQVETLAALRENPEFQQLRTVIQQNPQMIGPIIEQLSQSNPELLQMIEQHKDEFIALLMEGANPEDFAEIMGEEVGEEDLEPGAQVIQLTEQDRAAIARLESMGFDRTMVVEAYFACDKNEELAANFLLEQLQDQQ